MGRGDRGRCRWMTEVCNTTIPRSLSQLVAQGAGQADSLSVWTLRGGKNRGGAEFLSLSEVL